VKIDFSVKKRFIVNGKEYDSVEKMPDQIRDAYKKAMAGAPGQGHSETLKTVESKFVFNGNEYASEEDMLQEERELYKFVMKAMEKEGISMPGGIGKNSGIPRPDTRIPDVSGKPIVPESSLSPRKWLPFTAILVLLVGFAYLLFTSGG